VTDWLDGLQWDRTKRLKEWLPGIAGADPTELNKMAGVLLILGMIAQKGALPLARRSPSLDHVFGDA